MKTLRTVCSQRFHHGTRTLALLIALFVSTDGPAQEDASARSGAKDHVLFIGTDLSVGQDGKFYHVVGATKTTLKIEKGSALSDVRLGKGSNIKVTKGVKLSNRSAVISHVRTDSVDRASARAQLAAMQASMAFMDEVSDQRDRLQGAIIRAQTFGDARVDDPLFHGYQGADGYEKPTDANSLLEKFANALPALQTLQDSVNSILMRDIAEQSAADDEVTLDASKLPGLSLLGGSAVGNSAAGGSSKTFERAKAAGSTAEVELTFDVSSPEPLDHAYILVVANYASMTDADKVARQVSARELEQIDSHPRKVKMFHPASINGLPFKKFDIGLFANGQEVATNLSEKRMPLTSDQAFQFFLIDYLSTHKAATVAPTPMLMTPRAEFRRQVANTETNQTIYAKVDKMGKVLATSVDPAGKEPVTGSVESALRNVRFMPALEKGTPVDGSLKFKIADLVR